MSKTSEVDLVAQGVADHIKELIHQTVAWQIADWPESGDAYDAIHLSLIHNSEPTRRPKISYAVF